MDQKLLDRLNELHESDMLAQDHKQHLINLKMLGFEPNVIYDIGSCVLHWTNYAKFLWPEAKFILFDAFDKAEMFYEGYDYHIGVLSDQDNKEVDFYQNDFHPGGNSYYREIGAPVSKEFFPEGSSNKRESMTLDTIIKQKGFPLPDFIKMDVQGCEIDILKGGQEAIKNANYMIVELQFEQYNLGASLASESLPIIENMGFKCIHPLFSKNTKDGDYGFINNRSIFLE